MNPINRVGQKVVCIQDGNIWHYFCSVLDHWPILDQVYTVSDFGEIDGEPGIHLREIAGITCECSGLADAPWPIEIFRPLARCKTDISALTKLTKVTRVLTEASSPMGILILAAPRWRRLP